MKSKKIVIISAILIVVLLLSACGGSLPKGFKEINNEKSDGVTITQYLGSGSSENALKDFGAWAEKNGWKKISGSSEYSMLGYSGTAYEKGKNMMLIQAFSAAGQTTVMTVVAPKE